MPLDTGFRRQQSTCLDVFSVGRIHSKTSSSNSSCLFQLNSLHSNHHQSWVFLPVPGQGRDGRECDAHLHHRRQPAKALCPVRPGCTDQSFLSQYCLRLNQGEDRWLCTLLLKQGWRVEYSAASDSFTACPEVTSFSIMSLSFSVIVTSSP